MQLRVHEGEAVTPRDYYNGDIHITELDTRGLEAMLRQPARRRAVRAAAERRRRELTQQLLDMSGRLVSEEMANRTEFGRRLAVTATEPQLEQGGLLYHLLFCNGRRTI